MPRLLGRRRRGAGCGHHGWDCARGGDSGYVSDRCMPIVPGSSGAEEPENDPGVEAIMVELLVRREGITATVARERRAAEAAAAVAAARRRAALTPGARCALDDAADRAFWAGLDASRARLMKVRTREAAERDRKRAEIAAEAVPAVPEPTTPGEHRAARSGRLSARPLRVVGGVYDDDDPDPRVIMYAR